MCAAYTLLWQYEKQEKRASPPSTDSKASFVQPGCMHIYADSILTHLAGLARSNCILRKSSVSQAPGCGRTAQPMCSRKGKVGGSDHQGSLVGSKALTNLGRVCLLLCDGIVPFALCKQIHHSQHNGCMCGPRALHGSKQEAGITGRKGETQQMSDVTKAKK